MKRSVVRVVELDGPRGGTVYVHLLDCGHWFWRRGQPARTAVTCMSCVILPKLAELLGSPPPDDPA